MAGVKVTGINELKVKLKKNMDLSAVQTVVQKNGSGLQARAMRKAPVDTGNLKRSIGLEISDGGLTATSEAKAEYAPYQEWGTRFMKKAQPFMKQAFDVQKEQFKKDLDKLVR